MVNRLSKKCHEVPLGHTAGGDANNAEMLFYKLVTGGVDGEKVFGV